MTKKIYYKIKDKNNKEYTIRLHSREESFIVEEILDTYQMNYYKTIVDIGAHIGTYSILSAGYGALVCAVEASLPNYDLLVENIMINKLNNVDKINIVPIHAAISEKCGIDTLHYNYIANSGQRSLLFTANPDRFNSEEKVATITLKHVLDSIFPNYDNLDCLKIDVEGKEFDIIMNSTDEVIKFEYIDIDIHTPKNTDYFEEELQLKYNSMELIHYIEDIGYEIISGMRTSGKSVNEEIGDGKFLFRKV